MQQQQQHAVLMHQHMLNPVCMLWRQVLCHVMFSMPCLPFETERNTAETIDALSLETGITSYAHNFAPTIRMSFWELPARYDCVNIYL
jgi:hypothetical protein